MFCDIKNHKIIMKHFLRYKTSAEKEQENPYAQMSVENLNAAYLQGRDEWWACDRCKVIFEEDDVILAQKKREDKGFNVACPLKRGILRRPCMSPLICAESAYWKSNLVFRV